MGDINEEVQQLFITPAQMLRRGLKLLGVPRDVQERRSKSTNVRVFKSNFGPHPNQASTIWRDLLTTTVVEALVAPQEVDLKGFFIALHHLRVYLTDDQRNPIFGNPDFHEMGKTTWWWVQKIAALRHQKIQWPADEDFGDTVFIGTMDGTHVKCNEPRHDEYKVDPRYFSHKHKAAGFNIQVVLHLRKPECIHLYINRAGMNDMGNLKASGVLNLIPDGKRVVVDGGYQYEIQDDAFEKLSGYNQFDSEESKAFKGRCKARHETYNARLKVYEVLYKVFRHGVEKFSTYLYAVAVLVQYAITDEDPESADVLFDV